MAKTTRRNLLKVAAAGGVSAALGVAIKAEARAQQSSAPDEIQTHGHLDISDISMVGTFAEATVSFGYFPADSTVDRMQVANPGNRNGHQIIPNQVTIRAGGMVNFIVAGNHQVVVYDDGIQPRNINADSVLPPPLNNLIDDPNGRIYRGTSPSGVPANFFGPGAPAAAIPAPLQDRCEAVSFPRPGAYLVICGVRTHFLGGMYGFVTVLP
jgi:plastocyanin